MKSIIISILTLIILVSCEDTEVSNISLPFKEKIVIDSKILSYEKIMIRIARTLPDTSDGDDRILDAKASVTVDGAVYSLTSDADGVYSNPALIALPLKKYQLSVSWNNLTATAETTVPSIPQIDSCSVEYSYNKSKKTYYYKLYCYIRPDGDNIYANSENLTDIIKDKTIYSAKNKNENNEIKILENSYSSSVYDANPFDRYIFTIISFDKQFEAYYSTCAYGQSGDDYFSPTNANVIWNVKGDAVGLFIGESSVYYQISK